MKVLVIDDDDIAREMLCELIRDAGMAVTELPSAIGATKAILAEQVEALVVDLFMPSMNGDKLAKLVRGNPRTAHIAIVIVSSMGHIELERLRREADADAAIQKENVHEELLPTLRRLMRRRLQSERAPLSTGRRRNESA